MATVMDVFRLDGQVAVITGGTKGLGKAMATALAEAGATPVVVSRTVGDCEAVAGEIEGETGQKAVGIAADVTREDEVESLFAKVAADHGRLDVLINSAGINIRYPIEDFPTEEFKQVVDLNLTGSWLCCKAASRIMKEAGKGSVINVGSTLSHVGLEERTAYCASKSGVLGLTRALAKEWASHGVRCNALCPGPFLTEMNVPLLKTPEKVEKLIGLTALNRWADLHEIKGAAVFLASDASSYVTGSSVMVDGGWTC